MKQFVEIPDAGHMMPYEKANVQFFKAAKDFLEGKAKVGNKDQENPKMTMEIESGRLLDRASRLVKEPKI
jgi:hypothetical protein